MARRPADLIDAATCSACSAWSTSLTATSAPSAAKTSAMPRPMPRAGAGHQRHFALQSQECLLHDRRRSWPTLSASAVPVHRELIGAGFFQLFQKMNVPRLVETMISGGAVLVQVDDRCVASRCPSGCAPARARTRRRPAPSDCGPSGRRTAPARRADRDRGTVSRCDQKRLPVTKSWMPSPSMSAMADPWSWENVTLPAFFVEKSPMMGCSTKLMVTVSPPSSARTTTAPSRAPAGW